MNILIDIGHAAHVHYYRNLARELNLKGHHVTWTIKDIDIVKHLLDFYGYNYIVLPKKADNLVTKALMQVYYDYLLLRICRQQNIDIAIGTSATVTHVSRISKVKSLLFDDDDDDVQPLVTRFMHPYADTLLSPEALIGHRKRIDTVFFPGFMELAYLHPNRFIPDRLVLQAAGIEDEEPFFIMRFNVFKAHHDVGISGLSLEQKMRLIEIVKPYGKIFITTERNIEPELTQFQMKVSPEKVHSLMAFAKMFIGDSQTMTSEAAVLGVPSLRCNSFAGRISYLEEQEKKYGLTYAFLPHQFEQMLTKLEELLKNQSLNKEWQSKRQRLLADKIDVTAFMLWFIEKYPHSINEIKNKTEFWNQFR